MEAEFLARLIPGMTEYKRDQLGDTTLAELVTLKQHIEQETARFRKNTAQHVPGQEDVFQRLSATMRRPYDLAQAVNVAMHIDILGHADATGGEGKNLFLSQGRAEGMLATLAAHGLPKAVLSVSGVGSKDSLVQEVTDEARALNRRVSFMVTLTGIATR
jgi:OmpA-OmpF porin, OOP family